MPVVIFAVAAVLYVSVALLLSADRTVDWMLGAIGRHPVLAVTGFVVGVIAAIAGNVWLWYSMRDDPRVEGSWPLLAAMPVVAGIVIAAKEVTTYRNDKRMRKPR
jgi:hypothetical protein